MLRLICRQKEVFALFFFDASRKPREVTLIQGASISVRELVSV